jgi:ATP:cob(I)alamin adenosyltransferase
MNLYSRMLAAGGLAVLAVLGAVPAQAQAPAYPTRSITMIVPFAAGGPTDVISRIVTSHMAQTLGQSIIIENVVGAGGTTATTRAARATNDGYTLITGHMGTHAASVPLYPKLAYNPEKDFEPVALLAETPIMIMAKKDFAPKDLKEFVAYVKANADKVNAAHAGIGSVSNVSCELLNSVLGIVLADYNEGGIEMVLRPVQMKLFALGAELAAPDPNKASGLPHVNRDDTVQLEALIDSLGSDLPPLRNFILPGGTPAAARIHFARTVCRRAERAVVRLSRKEPVGDETIAYLNRLSDLLFVLARHVNAKAGVQEMPWKP